ncbi:MAG: hypothetical protein QXU32_13005, partial [Nitrososphaerales archaeon]
MPSLSYARLSKKPSLFRSFTGLEVSEFDDIYREVVSKYDEYESAYPGGRGKGMLVPEDDSNLLLEKDCLCSLSITGYT